jgi:hypothetical protein
VDIGGSLVKCVYLECPGINGTSEKESKGIEAMREFLKSNLKYGSSGMTADRCINIVSDWSCNEELKVITLLYYGIILDFKLQLMYSIRVFILMLLVLI